MDYNSTLIQSKGVVHPRFPVKLHCLPVLISKGDYKWTFDFKSLHFLRNTFTNLPIEINHELLP